MKYPNSIKLEFSRLKFVPANLIVQKLTLLAFSIGRISHEYSTMKFLRLENMSEFYFETSLQRQSLLMLKVKK